MDGPMVHSRITPARVFHIVRLVVHSSKHFNFRSLGMEQVLRPFPFWSSRMRSRERDRDGGSDSGYLARDAI